MLSFLGDSIFVDPLGHGVCSAAHILGLPSESPLGSFYFRILAQPCRLWGLGFRVEGLRFWVLP